MPVRFTKRMISAETFEAAGVFDSTRAKAIII